MIDDLFHRARKLTKRLTKKRHPAGRYGNKVWVPPQSQLLSNDDDDDVIPAKEEAVKPTKLVGYEMKTKRGNKQWVGSNSGCFLPRRPLVKPVRLGSVTRLRSRNKQWVNGQHTPSWGKRSAFPRRSVPGRCLTKWTSSSSVVSMDGGRYRVDPSGKKLKRVLSSSSSLIGGVISPAISGYLQTARNSFVKRKMAR